MSLGTVDPYITNAGGTLYFNQAPAKLLHAEQAFENPLTRTKIPFQVGETIDLGTANGRIVKLTVSIRTQDMDDYWDWFDDFETIASFGQFNFYYYNGTTDAEKRYLTGCFILGNISRIFADFRGYAPSAMTPFSFVVVASDPTWYDPSVTPAASDLTLLPGQNLVVLGHIYQKNASGVLTRIVTNTGDHHFTGGVQQGLPSPITWP